MKETSHQAIDFRVDPNLIDTKKADFVYESANVYLGETLSVADDLKKSATYILGVLIAIFSSVTGYIFLKCDIISTSCKDHPDLFIPGIIISIGYFIAIVHVVFGCKMARTINFRGNTPANLLAEDMFKDDIDTIKIRSAMGMQQRIAANVSRNLKTANHLNMVNIIAIMTPILSILVVLILKFIS